MICWNFRAARQLSLSVTVTVFLRTPPPPPPIRTAQRGVAVTGHRRNQTGREHKWQHFPARHDKKEHASRTLKIDVRGMSTFLSYREPPTELAFWKPLVSSVALLRDLRTNFSAKAPHFVRDLFRIPHRFRKSQTGNVIPPLGIPG